MSTSTPTRSTVAKSKWTKLAWILPVALVALFAVVLAAKGLRELPAVQSFVTTYPGESELPRGTPVGFPAWLSWQHFLNALLILLIIRSGWLVRTTTRPPAYWTRNNKGLVRTKTPPTKMSIHLWFHLSLDALWILNGVVFFVLIFATGQWKRLVPTSWDVFPNALSALLQYASLDWPSENGWVNYNGLQLLAYFATVFIAAPLAIVTGLRMSSAWPKHTATLNKLYPIEVARALHLPVMVYFVGFIIVHVTLVFTTGALRNLNHMYAARDGGGWTGFWFFAASLVVMIIGWLAVRPILLRPVAALTGSVTR
ncbi:cytochrome b/b6 domain-containing protein [Paeniglutamicibacter sp. ORCA_105]|uniref:cytochrome b/b6 domain-containing protein n=1 Tax=Paeniglutamicibacter sp. ORCA_105 TaxID=3377336 RepID=UPI0038948F47